MAYAIKAGVDDPAAQMFRFPERKTMYGGKHIRIGDVIFVFASENEGGRGLIAQGLVTSAEPIARTPSGLRQTPRVSIAVARTASATRPPSSSPTCASSTTVSNVPRTP